MNRFEKISQKIAKQYTIANKIIAIEYYDVIEEKVESHYVNNTKEAKELLLIAKELMGKSINWHSVMRWMERNVEDYIDRFGDVNMTQLAEAAADNFNIDEELDDENAKIHISDR